MALAGIQQADRQGAALELSQVPPRPGGATGGVFESAVEPDDPRLTAQIEKLLAAR